MFGGSGRRGLHRGTGTRDRAAVMKKSWSYLPTVALRSNHANAPTGLSAERSVSEGGSTRWANVRWCVHQRRCVGTRSVLPADAMIPLQVRIHSHIRKPIRRFALGMRARLDSVQVSNRASPFDLLWVRLQSDIRRRLAAGGRHVSVRLKSDPQCF